MLLTLYPDSTVDINQLTFHENTFSCELSDLGPKFKFVQIDGNRAIMVSDSDLEEIITFKLIHAHRNADHDVDYWLFRCADAGKRHLSLRIYND